MPVDQAELLVHTPPHLGGRDDVEDCEPLDALGPVEREPVRAPPAAIVTGHGKPIEAELVHRRDQHGRHVSLRARLDGRAPAVAW